MKAAPTPDAAPADDRPFRVGELTELIDAALRAGLPRPLRVLGEISNFRDQTHWWFALKDADARLDCVMFATAARRLGFRPENGQEVVATGRIEHYGKQGRTQMYVDRLEPVGAGALELKFRALCEELRALGWFEESRKRPPPLMPRKVAVLTSRTGAALQDVLDTMKRRCPAVEIALIDVRVQGDTAAPDIARALAWVSANHEAHALDAVLLTRGGGSMEDLWAFNERVVAEAIVRCPIPVVAAIGHETDTTIAELVADLRAATPTQAAMRLAPDRAALEQQLLQRQRRLASHLRHYVHIARRDLERADLNRALRDTVAHRRLLLERISSRLAHARPQAQAAARRARLAGARADLQAAIRARLTGHDLPGRQRRLDAVLTSLVRNRRLRLDSLARALDLASPINVLNRGYSVTSLDDGRILRDPSDAKAGDRLTTRLAHGRIHSIVDDDGPTPARAPSTPPRRPRAQPPSPPPDQMDLFLANG
ncbi:MAG: exodeoxyribonuclease VII large subunit [Phycisphaerales bacterium]